MARYIVESSRGDWEYGLRMVFTSRKAAMKEAAARNRNLFGKVSVSIIKDTLPKDYAIVAMWFDGKRTRR